MSTFHNNTLWLSPYDEVDRSVPDIGMSMLPDRIAVLMHPINSGGGILLVCGSNHSLWVCEHCGHSSRRQFDQCQQCQFTVITECRKTTGVENDDHMRPDVGTVADSGVGRFKPGDVLLLKPDTGKEMEPGEWDVKGTGDKRRLRLIGLPGLPWCDRILGRLTSEGFEPSPGWSLVERREKKSSVLLKDGTYEDFATCLSGEGEGGLVPVIGETYTFHGVLPKSYVLVRSQRSLKPFARAS